MTIAQTGPTDRFADAVRFAIDRHADADGTPHMRKGTTVPYLSHLLSVAALVWEAGGDEDQAIAGVLHDTLEDTPTTVRELEEHFGLTVARLVEACSDGLGIAGERDGTTWAARKHAYLDHLAQADPRAQLISAADKLHNATSIVTDAEAQLADDGTIQVWARFNAPPEKILWYYQQVLAALDPGLAGSPILARLHGTVARMSHLIPPNGQ